ncbi:MAG: DUF3160 domain-containing protein, partial [Candidatus Hodarchaeota archaeon]
PLYAKNPIYGGAGSSPYKQLKGYVEPNPEVFARLASLSKMLHDGLSTRNLLNSVYESKLLVFYSLLSSLRSMAEKELIGTGLSSQEHAVLNNINTFFEWISSNSTFYSLEQAGLAVQSYSAGDAPSELSSYAATWQSLSWVLEDLDTPTMARIEAIFRNVESSSLLYEAVGAPFVIYVIVPIDNVLYLTRGAVYSYYEIVTPSTQAISDLDWQNILDSEERPALPSWTQSYISQDATSSPHFLVMSVQERSNKNKHR